MRLRENYIKRAWNHSATPASLVEAYLLIYRVGLFPRDLLHASGPTEIQSTDISIQHQNTALIQHQNTAIIQHLITAIIQHLITAIIQYQNTAKI